LAESIVWKTLLKNKQTGYKFLRQKPIGRLILDFYCPQLLLAIEVDGSSHLKKIELDKFRDSYLDNLNIKTVRFTNSEVLNSIEEVKKSLNNFIQQRQQELHFPPPFSREGD